MYGPHLARVAHASRGTGHCRARVRHRWPTRRRASSLDAGHFLVARTPFRADFFASTNDRSTASAVSGPISLDSRPLISSVQRKSSPAGGQDGAANGERTLARFSLSLSCALLARLTVLTCSQRAHCFSPLRPAPLSPHLLPLLRPPLPRPRPPLPLFPASSPPRASRPSSGSKDSRRLSRSSPASLSKKRSVSSLSSFSSPARTHAFPTRSTSPTSAATPTAARA